MEKTLGVVLGLAFGLVLFVAVAEMIQAAPPVTQYTCPICGVQFYTYEELYQHFTTSHPSSPIDIIWE